MQRLETGTLKLTLTRQLAVERKTRTEQANSEPLQRALFFHVMSPNR